MRGALAGRGIGNRIRGAAPEPHFVTVLTAGYARDLVAAILNLVDDSIELDASNWGSRPRSTLENCYALYSY